MISRYLWSIALVMVLSGVAATSCGGDAARRSDGPLGVTGEHGVLCMAPPDSRRVTVGLDALRPSEAVTVETVELVDPERVVLVEAVMLPVIGRDLYGSFNSYPPDTIELAARGGDWEARRVAAGADIEAATGWNLLVGLEVEGEAGRVEAFRVLYSSAGGEYELVTSTAIEVRPAGSCG